LELYCSVIVFNCLLVLTKGRIRDPTVSFQLHCRFNCGFNSLAHRAIPAPGDAFDLLDSPPKTRKRP
jgi:hypothetical protein